jgi:hypothetical protein
VCGSGEAAGSEGVLQGVWAGKEFRAENKWKEREFGLQTWFWNFYSIDFDAQFELKFKKDFEIPNQGLKPFTKYKLGIWFKTPNLN